MSLGDAPSPSPTLSTPLAVYCGVLSLVWMTVTIVYYGIVFASPTLGPNVIVTGVLGSLVSAGGDLTFYFALDRLGRRICTSAASVGSYESAAAAYI